MTYTQAQIDKANAVDLEKSACGLDNSTKVYASGYA